MPYPKGFLESRAVIKPGIFSIIPPEGRVINSIPGFHGCKLTIIASPKYGASFVQYVGSVEKGGKTIFPCNCRSKQLLPTRVLRAGSAGMRLGNQPITNML